MTKSLTNVVAVFVRFALVSGLIATLVAVFSAGLRFEHRGGHVLTVQTNSMKPVFQAGDAIIAWRVDPANLRVGDIVSYRSLRDPSVVVSHRIVAISRDHSVLTTQGDALGVGDPAIAPQAVIGRVSAVAPGLGRLLTWLRSPVGLVVAVYLPCLIVIAQQTRQIVRIFHQPRYQLYGR